MRIDETVEKTQNIQEVRTMPIITGLQAFLQDLQGWMLILAIPFVAIQAITLGYSLVNSEDPQDERRIKSRFFKVVLGAAIVACAPWLANQILNYFM